MASPGDSPEESLLSWSAMMMVVTMSAMMVVTMAAMMAKMMVG